MIVVLEMPLVPGAPRDARRAALRARDAWLARSSPGTIVVEPGSPLAAKAEARLIIREPEAAVPPGAVLAAEASLGNAPAVAPAGYFPGGCAGWEPYVALWELEEIAARAFEEHGGAVGPSSVEAAPAELRRLDAAADAVRPAPGWLVHSFAGRRGHGRPEVERLVPTWARTVLEVGCGEGSLGASLSGKGARVVGIEPDVEAATVASRRLARVVAQPLETALATLSESFDAVVMADVLEHLEDPVAALEGVAARTAPSGSLVLSLPNASHVSVLAGALQGRWDPALEGIVVDDHRTYAGRRGWERLLAAAGWEVESWTPAALLPDRHVPWLEVFAPALSRDDLSAVQWLAVARKAPARGRVDLGSSEAGAPDPDDPVGTVAEALARSEAVVWLLDNAVSGEVLEPLLSGDVATGLGRRALSRAATAKGLEARFKGSGISVRVEGRDVEGLPASLERLLQRARAAGLAVRPELLGPERLLATFRREAA